MSVKTDRLTALLPDAYGASETQSLVYRLLDAVGAELMVADEKVKRVLKSHWVDYAEGEALDGLGAIYGVERRLLLDATTLEGDDLFRSRLRAVVPLFTGGGTVRAVRGAVQSALGLPFDLETIQLPPDLAGLRADLERLVLLEEFPLTSERVEFGPDRIVVEDIPATPGVGVGQESVMHIDLVAAATAEASPEIVWRIGDGGAAELSLERLGSTPRAGFRTPPSLFLPAGTVVRLEAAGTAFSAVLDDGTDITRGLVALSPGGSPALPSVPARPSRWRFAARGARFDVETTTFDQAAFDTPPFAVAIRWTHRRPLVFDVTVPWSATAAVAAILARYQFAGRVSVFAGLGHDAIKQAVEQTRAAGVQANLHFSVLASEDHDVGETFAVGERQAPQDAGASESLRLHGANRVAESQDLGEAFGFGADFDTAFFDGPFVFR